MSIQALTGLPGHGKSYSVVELFLIPAAKEGRPVVTNLPISDQFRTDFPRLEVHGFDLDKAKTDDSTWSNIPGGALVLLDELWRIWPAGLKANDVPAAQMGFIKEHRHRIAADGKEMDIVLVTQDLSDIASSVRSMCETTIICKKLVDIGAKGRFRRDYYRGAVKGFEGPKASFIRSDHGCKYTQDVWQYYRSHTKGESVSGAVDNSGVVGATIFNGWGFKAGVAGLLIVLVVAGSGAAKTTRDVSVMTKAKQPVVKEEKRPADNAVKPVLKGEPEKPKDSEVWRLVGSYAVGKSVLYYVISDEIVTRKIAPQTCSTTFIDTVCTVKGEYVASYTGRKPVDMALLPSAGLSGAANSVAR